MKQAVLKGKFLIEAVITLVTGLHIGTSSDFTPIGAVESPFVRDHFTKVPIIPGSRRGRKPLCARPFYQSSHYSGQFA